ncbi:MAG: hypothetical protein ACRYFV_01745 [Janthinobacterium lividum]
MQPNPTPEAAAAALRIDAQLEAASRLSSLTQYSLTIYDGVEVQQTKLYSAAQVEALVADILAEGKEQPSA